jgi:pyruvate-ferredoxin/flavodoxin oxidoreductase
MRAARLALESRAFPFFTFDPDAGPHFSDALSLDGNPAIDEPWPTYALEYTDDSGAAQRLDAPLTIADWAATEGRFRKHFSVARESDDLIPFHEYVALPEAERGDRTPFIHTVSAAGKLGRLRVSPEIVLLAEERQQYWGQLKELAGVAPAPAVRDRFAESLQADFDRRADTLRSEYEGKLAELHASYPRAVARRLAEALLRGGGGTRSIKDLVTLANQPENGRIGNLGNTGNTGNAASASTASATPVASPPPRAPTVVAQPAAKAPAATAAATAVGTAVVESDDAISMEPYIDSARCTTCNECTNLNARMFAYDANKQAVIKDQRAGTFQQLVVAAERCPVGIIHPGTPLNPKEKDLAKWVKRAVPFN